MKLYQVKHIVNQLKAEANTLKYKYNEQLDKTATKGKPIKFSTTLKVTATWDSSRNEWDYVVNGEKNSRYESLYQLTYKNREALNIPKPDRTKQKEYADKLDKFVNEVETTLILSEKPAMDELKDLLTKMRSIK